MSKFVIVGGGITGCVIAYYLLNKKMNVTIIEKKKKLGGLLKDFEIDSKKFFKGCQYITENSKWIELLNFNTKKELYKFQHNYASLTESNQIIFEKNFPGPVFKKKRFNIKKYNKLNNLSDVYNFFSSEIKSDLIKIFQKFNLKFKKLHFKSRYAIKFFRILFLDNEKRIKKLKKEKDLDEILGLKNYNEKNSNSLLPKNGYDKFFNECYKYLSKKSKVMLSTAAIPSWKNGQLEIKTKDKIFKDCKIIWTANPTILVKRICNEKLDTTKIQYIQYSTNIKKKYTTFM